MGLVRGQCPFMVKAVPLYQLHQSQLRYKNRHTCQKPFREQGQSTGIVSNDVELHERMCDFHRLLISAGERRCKADLNLSACDLDTSKEEHFTAFAPPDRYK